jgi:hypothetical protein
VAETLALTEEKRQAFIVRLRDSANVRESCQAASISRPTAYRWRKHWTTFRREWEEALEDACDDLETVARKRAKDESDKLLMFLLRAHRPAKYADQVHVAGEMEHTIFDLAEWRRRQKARRQEWDALDVPPPEGTE